MIYREGDQREEIFIVIKGELAYLNSQGHECLSIKQYDMVGDIEVMEDSKRQYFAATKTDVTMLFCKVSIFLDLIARFPEVQAYMKKKVKKKNQILKEVEQQFQDKLKKNNNTLPQLRRYRNKKNNNLSLKLWSSRNDPGVKEFLNRVQNFSIFYLSEHQQ